MLKFEVNEKYKFTITKKIIIDKEEFFVLTDSKNKEHLLKSSVYSHYNLQLNSKIICKVDKINCNGKIFLEPEHPYLKENKYYNFFVTEIQQMVTKDSISIETLLIIKDEKNKTQIAIYKGIFNYFDIKINAKIDRITKARLILKEIKIL